MTDREIEDLYWATAARYDPAANHAAVVVALARQIEKAAINHERSECAKVCEDRAGTMSMFANSKDAKMHNNAIAGCAAAIRARSQP